MTIARNGQWEILDYTSLTELVEREDNALEALGLFEEYFGQTTLAEAERVTVGHDVITDKARGGERNYADKNSSKMVRFDIPFFPMDSYVKPSDVQDFREYATDNAPASVERGVLSKIKRIRNSHDKLRRTAMYACLKGNTYAPSGSSQFVKNFATEWGVTGDVATPIAIDFTVATTDPALVIEVQAREHIIDKAQDNAAGYSVVALCGSGFFNSMVNHPLVQAAYDQYASTQEPLRDRLGGNRVGRIFVHKGVSYIEDVSGEIARGDAYILPLGIMDMFSIHYAPADTLEHANTTAQPMYVFLEEGRRASTIETETSFVCINSRAELIVVSTGNTLLPNA